MKFHKNYDYYINYLSKIFKDIPKIEVVLKNFDVLKVVVDNDNSASVEEVSYDVNLSEQRIRVKLRELENEGIITSKKEKKPNHSYKKKYYSSLLTGDFIDEFRKYISCYKCGNTFGKFGGIVHQNRPLHSTKIFCSKECRNEWCYDGKHKNT